MNGSCQCGAVTFTTPTPQPVELWHCHCTDCRKQSGSAFGTSAFFPYFEVSEEKGNGPVGSFVRVCDSGKKQRCEFFSISFIDGEGVEGSGALGGLNFCGW